MKSLLFVCLLALSASAHTKNDVVGCYSVLVANADEQPSPLKKPGHMVRAKTIRLTPMLEANPWTRNSAFQVSPVNPADKFDYLAAYWTFEKDELSIIWSNTGLSGVQMTLTSSANGFEGIIEEFWDFAPFTTNKRRAVLTRKSC